MAIVLGLKRIVDRTAQVNRPLCLAVDEPQLRVLFWGGRVVNVVSTSSTSQREPSEWLSPRNLRLFLLAAATVIAVYLCLEMAHPFLPALTWAVALAVIGRPIHRWLHRRINNPHVAAGVAVTVVAVILLVPVILVAQRLAQETAQGIEVAKDATDSGRWRKAIEREPRLAPILRWFDLNVDIQGEVSKVISASVGQFTSFLGGSIWAIAQLMLTLFMLFFFFRDHHLILDGIRDLVPLSDAEATDVFRRVSDTIHATIYGTILVSMIQGTLGGLMFWWLGLPGPIVWGFVMALLAVIPYLGAFVVWVPAAIFLLLEGNWVNALILTFWGMIVVGLIDNLLYPFFVGKRLRLHSLVAFLAIFGGLIQFGAAGIVLGPVILAITFALLDIWNRRTQSQTRLPEVERS